MLSGLKTYLGVLLTCVFLKERCLALELGSEPRTQVIDSSVQAGSASSDSKGLNGKGAGPTPVSNFKCAQGNLVCEKERFAFEAITELHGQLDDDKNGDIDLAESEGFLREELQYKSPDKRLSDNFHSNDNHITVDDLWRTWRASEVHNWTLEQVVLWLAQDVELPQYEASLRIHYVDGSSMPRLAVNHLNFMSTVLGIKSAVSRQKLSLKAMDVVLFGPPRHRHSLLKDVLLAAAIAIAVGGIWFARHQYRLSQRNLSRWETDLLNLQSLQEKLVHEKQEKEHLSANKLELEAKIKLETEEAKAEAERLQQRRMHTETELTRLKMAEDELLKVREALAKAERELEMHRGGHTSSAELQQWLQLTYELEQRGHAHKKAAAEAQLALAKQECEKLTRKRNAFLGSLRMAHSHSFDALEYQIVEAREALDEVKMDFIEQQRRWHAIEQACGLQVETNPGLAALLIATGQDDPQKYAAKLAAPTLSAAAVAATATSSGTTGRDVFSSTEGTSKHFWGSSINTSQSSLDAAANGDSSSRNASPEDIASSSLSISSEPPWFLPSATSEGSDGGDMSSKRSMSCDLPRSAHDDTHSGLRRRPVVMTAVSLPAPSSSDATTTLPSGSGVTAQVANAVEDVKKQRPTILASLSKLRMAKTAASAAIKERSLATS